ncbi:hypothetical protein RchiOBHm_Chr6g0290931 [Rosa chinensis]|uniref:Uncharacterized protein n=1 Tax=Rosa chinensis TaxID=74649 RepID=A0A2P6PVY6_ROSCH|nr:hypothetical protein RchiOBHm_Chr6g0290931 [Rosa chinensis]
MRCRGVAKREVLSDTSCMKFPGAETEFMIFKRRKCSFLGAETDIERLTQDWYRGRLRVPILRREGSERM